MMHWLGTSAHLDCPECNGSGGRTVGVYRFREGREVECGACFGTGVRLCQDCGNAQAVVVDELGPRCRSCVDADAPDMKAGGHRTRAITNPQDGRAA